jgi:hypothetical protein
MRVRPLQPGFFDSARYSRASARRWQRLPWRALHLIAPAFGPATPVGTASRRGDLSAAAPNVLICVRFCRQRAF